MVLFKFNSILYLLIKGLVHPQLLVLMFNNTQTKQIKALEMQFITFTEVVV